MQSFVFYINSFRVRDPSDLKAVTGEAGETVKLGKSSEKRASQNDVYCGAKISVIILVTLGETQKKRHRSG